MNSIRATFGRHSALVCAGVLCLVTSALAAGRPAEPLAEPWDAALEVPTSFIRVASDEQTVALEIAARRFAPKDGAGPAVTLVGVVHIGDHVYYRAVQDLLARHDLVLYESVKPAGTGGAGGETDAARVDSTQAALGYVGSLVEFQHQAEGRYPADLEAARDFAFARDPRLAEFLDDARTDAWGRPLAYAVAGPEEGGGYRLLSYGADGEPGGEGADADIALAPPVGAMAFAASKDNMQSQLASALALAFQLDAIDYGQANWRCSDMSVDQVSRSMRERGSDFELVEGTLAGTTLPAQIVRALLGLIRMLDAFTDGGMSDTLKVLLIEMLGDEAMIQQALNQVDPGFAEVIIIERNDVVIDDLEALIASKEDPASVGILYGAGHMPDMAEKLMDDLGYIPVKSQWLRAIEVDLTQSPMTERDLRQLRMMMRSTMRRMGQMQRGQMQRGQMQR